MTGIYLRPLDLGHEQSIPTYFSAFNLAVSSVLLFIVFTYEKMTSSKFAGYWMFLSLLFLFLSFDEAFSIHEQLGKIPGLLAEHGYDVFHLKSHKWVPFGILFVVLIGLYLIPFFRSLPKNTFFQFAAAALIFLSGAIGFEYVGALMLERNYARTDFLYLFRRVFEEGLEMSGVAFFNCILFRQIVIRDIRVSLHLFSEAPQSRR